MADKIDPYDVAALERSLNDSATRVSTIWVSFLIFSLYLLIAAATVEHRQLFLAEPVKLPVLNIDLPLWGFFFLAPILFVIFHTYVILQVLLLGRTAAAYNDAVNRSVKSPTANAVTRQRLANTLFAQIFAGSPRERDGWLGWLLKAMAWITLAIGPIAILLVFQFSFLPYHSHLATWMHRLLILIELAIAFSLWPLVLDAQREMRWPKLWRPLPVGLVSLFVLLSFAIATFPGEPLVNLFTGQPLFAVQCDRWPLRDFDRLNLRLDRLVLPNVDVVDDEKLAKFEQATASRNEQAHDGERTRNFRDRDLNCSDLSYADLRRVDLSGARLTSANLRAAALQGASLDKARLQGADLFGAKFQGASLYGAQLQGASLWEGRLMGASLDGAQLQGATLRHAHLQGASLEDADLQGAYLDYAELQGAFLNGAQLQGASLDYAQLQGASLEKAQLQGASLAGAQLQGTDLKESSMTHAYLSGAHVWRAKGAACRDGNVSGLDAETIMDFGLHPGPDSKPVRVPPDEAEKFIERSVAGIPDTHAKKEASKNMRAGIGFDPTKDDTAKIAKVWSDCEAATKKKPQAEFDSELAIFLRNLVCDAKANRKAIITGIVRNWISKDQDRRAFSALLARGLFGQDGKDCAATQDLDDPTKKLLRAAIAAAVATTPATAAPAAR